MTANSEPADLEVYGQNLITIRDVLVGEVWLAAGQSNMGWPVHLTTGAAREISLANFPFVRHVRIEAQASPTPLEAVKTSGWQRTTPQSVPTFAAIPYFFARQVHRHTVGIPVGIVEVCYADTEIEAWMSDDSRRRSTIGDKLSARWEQAKREWTPERAAHYATEVEAWKKAEDQAQAAKTANPLPSPKPPATEDSPARPGSVYNGMIAPLQPMALRGILWYQGESNVDRPDEYGELFVNLIRSWRTAWRQNDLPFLFVQLPNYAGSDPNGDQWAWVREAQSKALALPLTGMAVTIDIGDPNNLHPPEKQEVGRRLALIALARIYDVPGEWTGPKFVRTTRDGATLHVHFQNATTGLITRNGEVQSLEVAGADKVFYPAKATINGETLVVSAPEVKEPVAVRYAWKNAPRANLFNRASLPAIPFRSDNW